MTLLYALILLPLAGAILAWLIPSNRVRPLVIPFVGLAHLGLVGISIDGRDQLAGNDWLRLDPLGAIVLLSISVLFVVCAWYAVDYLRFRHDRDNRILSLGMLACLSAMSLVCLCQHLGLLWVAVEMTTVSMAPLIYFNHNARSIEATWKYLLICSVGIGLALLGLLFLAYGTFVARQEATLQLAELISQASRINPGWLHAAFIFQLVGYGSKLGLAPLNTWKPDAYGEAPGLVGALLAGGLVNCAFLALLRIYQVCSASGFEIPFVREALIVLGLFSMAVAALFMAHQNDFKRMLAYSSVEHVGIMAVGLGLGRGALWAVLFHLVSNGLTKGVLFLTSGNIHRSYGGKTTEQVQGALKRLPWSGGLFLAGFVAVAGSPPFSLFISEFAIVGNAVIDGRYWVAAVFLLCLIGIFIGMSMTVIPMIMGKPRSDLPSTTYRDRFGTVAPALTLLLVVVWFGIWPPEMLIDLFHEGATLLELRP